MALGNDKWHCDNKFNINSIKQKANYGAQANGPPMHGLVLRQLKGNRDREWESSTQCRHNTNAWGFPWSYLDSTKNNDKLRVHLIFSEMKPWIRMSIPHTCIGHIFSNQSFFDTENNPSSPIDHVSINPLQFLRFVPVNSIHGPQGTIPGKISQ